MNEKISDILSAAVNTLSDPHDACDFGGSEVKALRQTITDALGCLKELDAALRASSPAQEPVTTEPVDPLAELVAGFAKALLAKLRLAEANGRSGWEKTDWESDCQQGLLCHVAKGDPRDVAAYCAFMWHHDWIAIPAPPQPGRDAVIEECAKWHEDRAALETNSLHCGDNSATIAGAHRVAAFHRFSARELRALIGEPK